jgi:L-arabonate dehydrase
MSAARELRSTHWFGSNDKTGFGHRSWLKNFGTPDDVFDGRPVIGICNTASELSPCNLHLTDVAKRVAIGVWEAGGFPLEFPTISLGEPLMRPTAMVYRNLMSMDVEESLRANPIDGAVLLGGCDKTTPALLMGAASVDLPAIMLTGGPMLNGKFEGRDIGSGTDVWRFSDALRTGAMSETEFRAAEACMHRSAGHCMTMGTASTMACMSEALGIAPSGSATIPAVDARRATMAQSVGRRIVEMTREGLRPSQILTRTAFENAIRVNAAIGGSTNAIIHLLAIAGRAGVELELEDFDRLARDVPLLVDLVPSGSYLMEDFHYAGGLPALLRSIGDLLDLAAPTVSGRTLGEEIADAPVHDPRVIRPREDPLSVGAGTAVLKGNLAPRGAVIKQSAASPALMCHRGPAKVFDAIEDYQVWADDPGLVVDPGTVLVLRNAGPRGYPGMPEVGNLALPKVLLAQGVTDMVRISDARMSGTSYGTVVLHVAPESAVGGPLALVRDGDMIELDVPGRSLTLDVPQDELDRRTLAPAPEHTTATRGYLKLFVDHVMQADQGVDFDFLVGRSGDAVPRRSF